MKTIIFMLVMLIFATPAIANDKEELMCEMDCKKIQLMQKQSIQDKRLAGQGYFNEFADKIADGEYDLCINKCQKVFGEEELKK